MSLRLDANETTVFLRDLEYIKTNTYDTKYAANNARFFIPTESGKADWAETLTYRQYTQVGASDWIANYGDDLPRCDVYGKEFSIRPKPFGQSYGYNIQEIKASQRPKGGAVPLEQRKSNSTKRAFGNLVNRIAWFGRGRATEDAGTYGLLYNTSVTVGSAPTGTWSTATPDEIIADVAYTINTPITLTKGVEVPDTCLMGIASMTKLTSTRLTDTGETLFSFIQKAHPGVTFMGINELDAVNPKPSAPTVSASTNILLAYKRDSDHLTLEIPLDYTQEPADPRNLEWVVNTHGRIAGVFVYYPLAVHIVEGV